MAMVDADHNFTYVDTGCQGHISDGEVFRNTTFFQKLEKNQVNLPASNTLEGRQQKVPYVFAADNVFPLKPHIMKSYTGLQDKGSSQRSFNYRLSRERRVFEKCIWHHVSYFSGSS